jgi:hypothetical protein
VSSNAPVAEATLHEDELPQQRVQEPIGHLVAAAEEGLLALGVGVGLGVLTELIGRRSTTSLARRGSATRSGLQSGVATRMVS